MIQQLIQGIKDWWRGVPTFGMARSPKWAEVRKEWLRGHPVCAVCGGAKKLSVHHQQPFHLFPEKELDFNNLITLCESGKGGVNCHLHFGHLGNFQSYNTNVETDTDIWRIKIKNRP